MIQGWPQSQHPAGPPHVLTVLDLPSSHGEPGASGDLRDTGSLPKGAGEQQVPDPSPQLLSGNAQRWGGAQGWVHRPVALAEKPAQHWM